MQRKKLSPSRWLRLPPAGSTEYKSSLVLVMGLLFFMAGCWTILTIPHRFYLKSKLDEGVIVPARILKVKKASRGSLSVRYEFLWKNRVIQGDRASVLSESNGLYHRLLIAHEQGHQVPCYVDPNNPELNALEKEIKVLDVIVMFILGLPFTVAGSLYLIRFMGVSRKTHPKKHRVIKN